MPRKPRFYLPGVPVHVLQRGHNREPVFFEPGDLGKESGRQTLTAARRNR